MSTLLYSLGRWSYRHGWRVLIAWLLLLGIGGDDDELGARAACLGEGATQLFEAFLGLGTGDREGVIGALAEHDGARSTYSEQQQPRDQHPPSVTVRPTSQ